MDIDNHCKLLFLKAARLLARNHDRSRFTFLTSLPCKVHRDSFTLKLLPTLNLCHRTPQKLRDFYYRCRGTVKPGVTSG
jgi:hypothetical protein